MGSITPGNGFQALQGSRSWVGIPTRLDWVNDTTVGTPVAKRTWGDTGGPLGADSLRRQLFGAVNKTFSPWRRSSRTKGRDLWTTKTIERSFDTRLTDVATNTTLGTATRYDATSGGTTLTINIPETGRRFVSVRTVTSFRSDYTVTTGITGTRMVIKLGAATEEIWDHSHTTVAVANRPNFREESHDVTAYFNTNFGSGTSQTCTASLAVSTDVAANINGITFKVIITYAYDKSIQAGTTRAKTLRIPIQGMTTFLTTSQQEIGSDGVNPCTSQIPKLDTFLPEASVTIRQSVIEFAASDGLSALTTFTPYIQIDAIAEVARAPVAQANWATPQRCPWRDSYDITAIATNVAHTLSMRTDLANRLPFANATLVVTYEYNEATTTTAMFEGVIPLIPSTGISAAPPEAQLMGTTTNDMLSMSATLNIQEPGPITIAQSAVYLNLYVDGNAGSEPNIDFSVGGQPFRVLTSSGGIGMEQPIAIRADNASGWTLARGQNRLDLKIRQSNANSRRFNVETAYAIINYTAAVPAGGAELGNRPVSYFVDTWYDSVSSTTFQEGNVAKRPQLGYPYKISGVMIEARSFSNGANRIPQFNLECKSAEWGVATGWITTPRLQLGTGTGWTSAILSVGVTPLFNLDSLHTGRLDVEAARRQLWHCSSAICNISWAWWVTYHQIEFTVSGTVRVDGINPGRNKLVKIYADDGDTTTSGAELVGTALTDDSGAFSFKTLGSARSHFATYAVSSRYGRSLDGTPGTSTFDITIGAMTASRLSTPLIGIIG